MSALAEKEKITRSTAPAVTRNKVEQALIDAFAAAEPSLPGGKAVQKLRREAIASFAVTGLPHRRIEEWKYTDLRNMLKEAARPAVPAPGATCPVKAADINAALGELSGHDVYRVTFVDGHFERALSNVKMLPRGVHVLPLSGLLAEDKEWIAGYLAAGLSLGPVVALNTAYMTDGAAVRIEDGVKLDKPLVLVFVRASAEAQLVTTRNDLRFGAGSAGAVLEAHIALSGAAQSGQSNTVTSISIGDEARVTHVKIASELSGGAHLSTLLAEIGRDAVYRPFQKTAGGLARNEISILYKGEGAKLDLSGVFLARGRDHVDTTLTVDHAVPRCESRELFKGVLDGESRGVFQGKIIVRPDAQKTDGKQMAQALMLSPDAEFDSKPELEIYADDVVCGHGSTAAEIDEDLLFYCRSRGIPLAEARAMLTESFIGEAIDRIENEIIREAVRLRAYRWLRKKAASASGVSGGQTHGSDPIARTSK